MNLPPHMLIWALRYGLGRSSYAVGLIADEIDRVNKQIPADVRQTLIQDLTEYLDRYSERAAGVALGDLDRKTWVTLLAKLKGELP